MGLFSALSKFKSGLAKTRDSIVSNIQKLAATKSTIDDELLNELEDILIAGDVGVQTAEVILSQLKRRVKEEKYESTAQLTSLLKEVVESVLHVGDGNESSLKNLPVSARPFVVMVVGVNGAGKTTTIGKMAYQYRQAGHKVVIGAADTFRAAANEQLEIWAQRAGVDIVQQSHGADPASVAFDAVNSAISKHADVVIIDTAGRLHTKTNLMEELKKIKRVMAKCLPGAPHEVLLVLDATTGQNGLQQVKHFTEAVEVTGLVLTKLDGTAKGGIVLAISNEMKMPVKFIGVGEKIDDLQPFDRRAFADALFEGEHESLTQ
ncbi:MAG: signal recognition particle-docking protein FtsY [Ignavibacteriae bacterium]|nr:MAG: signal recognition particle-docking protein FtsY [Ignavibacteriota bacterium]